MRSKIPKSFSWVSAAFLLTFSVPANAISQTYIAPPAGLVSWWDGDSVSATTAFDIQDGNHGTFIGDATIAPGYVGQAFSFDGDGDFIEVPDDPSLTPPTSSITIEAWINPRTISGSRPTGGRVIASKYHSGPPHGDYSWTLNMRDGGKLRFGVYESNVHGGWRAIDTDQPVLVAGAWQHVAATFSLASQEIKIFVNGVEAASSFVPGHDATLANIWDSSSPVRIGCAVTSISGYVGVPVAFWDGMIDEVSIYGRALSAEEIQAIFNAGSHGKLKGDTTPPLVVCSVAGSLLWPPNHKLVDVGLDFAAVDETDTAPTVDVLVFSDEGEDEPKGHDNHDADDDDDDDDGKDKAKGHGERGSDAKDDDDHDHGKQHSRNRGKRHSDAEDDDEDDDHEAEGHDKHGPDATYDGGTLWLRAERQGHSDGRVYLIVVIATDAAGNEGFDCCTVVVPHSKSKKDIRDVQDQAEAAEAFCREFAMEPPGYQPVGNQSAVEP